MHNYESRKLNAGIVGARGYAGLELARILLKHPFVSLKSCLASEKSFSLHDYLPEEKSASIPVFPADQREEMLAGLDLVFLATPNEVSEEFAPKALKAGVDVIDLSGAFRFKEGVEYGLIPWAGPAKTAKARLIANPGCYATSILMALIPLLKEGLIQPESVVIDAKSGSSGAGRKAKEDLLFCEVDGECLPYKVGKHQHLPEIVKYVKRFASADLDPMFCTHLLPVRRGIISSIYAKTLAGVTEERIQKAYEKAYAGYPLARFGRIDDDSRNVMMLKRVTGSARTEIRFRIQDGKLYLFSLIDNLMKGAASQAVENMNRLHDFPVTTALTELEGNL